MKNEVSFDPSTLSPFPVLETERLTLRNLDLKDAQFIFEQRSDKRVLKYLDKEPLTELEQATEIITKILEDWKAKKAIAWILESKKDKTFLGDIALWRFFEKDHRAEIGYGLNPNHWRKGYMKEASVAILDWAFSILGLHSIVADINPDNNASKQLLLSLGFQKEGYHRENYFFRGEYLDSEMYGLLERDFKEKVRPSS